MDLKQGGAVVKLGHREIADILGLHDGNRLVVREDLGIEL